MFAVVVVFSAVVLAISGYSIWQKGVIKQLKRDLAQA